METILGLIFPASPTWQAVQNILLAIVTSTGVVLAARMQANRKSPQREGIEDEQKFRFELRDDNVNLRSYIRELKIELVAKEKEIDTLRARYYALLDTRHPAAE